MEGQNSTTNGSLLKLILAIFLVIVIAFTLFYFNIIPGLPTNTQTASNNISSLPQTQNQKTGMYLQNIVIPSEQQAFTNDKTNIAGVLIPQSSIKVYGPLRITVELVVKMNDKSASDASAGYIFRNLTPDLKAQNDVRSLYLFYNKPSKGWVLLYKYGNQSKFLNVLQMPSGKVYGKFTFDISANGKSVIVTSPTGEQKTFELPDSLYTITNQMISLVQLLPNTEVDFFSLNYLYTPASPTK